MEKVKFTKSFRQYLRIEFLDLRSKKIYMAMRLVKLFFDKDFPYVDIAFSSFDYLNEMIANIP